MDKLNLDPAEIEPIKQLLPDFLIAVKIHGKNMVGDLVDLASDGKEMYKKLSQIEKEHIDNLSSLINKNIDNISFESNTQELKKMYSFDEINEMFEPNTSIENINVLYRKNG